MTAMLSGIQSSADGFVPAVKGGLRHPLRRPIIANTDSDKVPHRWNAVQGDDGRSSVEQVQRHHGECRWSLFVENKLGEWLKLTFAETDQIDEAHERGAYTDLLLGLLKK
jgi:hypothetical protein